MGTTRIIVWVDDAWQIIWWRLHEQLYSQPEGTVPIWMDGRWVMRSPIAEPGRCGDPIKINALSRDPGYPEWTEQIPCVDYNRFIGDLDNNQFQPNIHDFTNNTVVPSGADREANHDNNNRLRITNTVSGQMNRKTE